MLHVDLHILHACEVVSRKTDFFYSPYKKTKIGAKISLLVKLLFVFFAQPTENVSFHKTVCAHIEYEDMHADIFYKKKQKYIYIYFR
jgi:hypothetical protein